MKELIQWIKNSYKLTAIPVRIKNEKRWESMDEIIEREPFEGIPHRIRLDDQYGVIIYDWNDIDSAVTDAITNRYVEITA